MFNRSRSVKGARFFATCLVVALAMPLVFVVRGFSVSCLLPLILAPLAWTHVRRLRTSGQPAELIALLGATGKLLALYALLFGGGLVLARHV